MHKEKLHVWQHSHTFDQDRKKPGETRTLIVIAITGIMMIVEVGAGIIFGSMALLADGVHMASHAVALGINAFAYIYARRNANNEEYSFGTGKVNALGGFSGAILLAVFALLMAGESVKRLIIPVEIIFNQAILVAVLGLIVNGVSLFILGRDDHSHKQNQAPSDKQNPHHDHNLRSAYLHVLADALTSLLAIFALLTAKYFGLVWMDPVMGIVGAILVSRWSLKLLNTTGSVLLDKQGPRDIMEIVTNCIERHDDNRVADLHLWSIGPDIYAAEISIVTHIPKPSIYYKKLIPANLGLLHLTVEVQRGLEEDAPVSGSINSSVWSPNDRF